MKKSKWTPQQINQLLVKAKNGSIRLHAFEEVARATGRKANSVRNFYYKLIAEKKAEGHDKQIFRPFEKADINSLLREIVLATSRGESVRSVCMNLSKGNRSSMLRLQNKYRSILKQSPNEITRMVKLLESQGYFVKNPIYADSMRTKKAKPIAHIATIEKKDNIILMPERKNKLLTDGDINNLFMGLVRLVKKNANDEQVFTLKSQIDNLKAEIERLKNKTSNKATK